MAVMDRTAIRGVAGEAGGAGDVCRIRPHVYGPKIRDALIVLRFTPRAAPFVDVSPRSHL